jgi:hypothetical protein
MDSKAFSNWSFEYRFHVKTLEWKGGKPSVWGSFNLQKSF